MDTTKRQWDQTDNSIIVGTQDDSTKIVVGEGGVKGHDTMEGRSITKTKTERNLDYFRRTVPPSRTVGWNKQ